jgi:hypothetical protein
MLVTTLLGTESYCGFLLFSLHTNASLSGAQPRAAVKCGCMVQPGTLTISLRKNSRVEFPPPRRNTPEINFFHHRNQITNPHVQIVSVNSS